MTLSQHGSPPAESEQPCLIVCTYCGTAFRSRSQLFKHLRAKHDLDAQLQQDDVENAPINCPSRRTAASIAARSVYHNEAHDAYYRAQAAAGVFSIKDWEEAQTYFRTPLPVAFRIMWRARDEESQDIRFAFLRRLLELVPPGSLQSCPVLDPELAQTAIIPPRQWSIEAQQALVDAQEVGVANRQELCSMIPPLLLLQEDDVLVGRGTVLDLCAAPGSKSLQLLDQLQRLKVVANPGEPQAVAITNTSATTMLVCNDTNRQRLLTVARRTRRCPASVRPSVILNSSDGRYFPALRKYGGYKVKFDRVLADVPCSGDGTLRKLSAKEWKDWNVKRHLQLHALQVRLLTRALESVKKGGRVVYSTCSLDPIEDEAVVVTAISRRGGPSVYRICPIPDKLCKLATRGLMYSPGATQWVVPHPEFGKESKKHGVTFETYTCMDQVPAMLRKKDIRPSMFPPRERRADALANLTDDTEKFALARKYGEILDENDIVHFEDMLPNCARIFPQHLDSGGFFCAVIERVAPAFYPVCYPLERRRQEATGNGSGNRNTVDCTNDCLPSGQTHFAQPQPKNYKYHGRILANVESAQHMRDLLVRDKARGEEVIFEGLSTMQVAIQWLKEKRAYFEGLSEQLLEAPMNTAVKDSDDMDNYEEEVPPQNARTRQINDPTKSSMFTRLFPPPHPRLVAEFCDFFGLLTCPQKATLAGVEVFPTARLAVVGGGHEAVNVESCFDPDEAHTAVLRYGDDMASKIEQNGSLISKKRRFLQLVLVSEELRNLFLGGAKFSPMEAGLALCWVPVPGKYWEYGRVKPTASEHEETVSHEGAASVQGEYNKARFEDPIARSSASGRYGLLDEAAEYLGRCATKRMVSLTNTETLQLLNAGFLMVSTMDSEGLDREATLSNETTLGEQRLNDLHKWSLGAAISVTQCGHSKLFMPCVLRTDRAEEKQLGLLAEQRLTEAWKRLLEAI
jgi:16S rRNA C967 or C1407 C5-methylase (RsmB/RsmF family)